MVPLVSPKKCHCFQPFVVTLQDFSIKFLQCLRKKWLEQRARWNPTIPRKRKGGRVGWKGAQAFGFKGQHTLVGAKGQTESDYTYDEKRGRVGWL